MTTNTYIPTVDELDAMTPTQYKAVENRLRAAAKRQGMRLEKSRVRDPRALDYATYRLVYLASGHVAARTHTRQYGLTLTEVAEHLFADDIS